MDWFLISMTFLVTALYDVILQLQIAGEINIPFIQHSDWINLLKDKKYFQKHTPLAAALIAGIVGAITQIVILLVMNFPRSLAEAPLFLFISFIISALIGWPMRWSDLFPHLEEAYYEPLAKQYWARPMITDAMSGIIVQITLIGINLLYKATFSNYLF